MTGRLDAARPISRGSDMLRIYDRFLDGLALVAAILIFAIMVGTGVDVGMRFIFRSPIGWMLEYTEYALLTILFFGMAWLVRQRGHVAIELIVDIVPIRAARVMRLTSTAAAGLVSALLAFWAGIATVDDIRRGVETFGIYPIPRGVLFAIVTLGFTLTAIEFCRWVIVQISGAEDEKPAGADKNLPELSDSPK